MSTRPTEPFRAEHAELLSHIDHIRLAARAMRTLSPAEREAVVERVLIFLRETLLPHARAEEAVLYPAWAELVGHPAAAAPMIHDHEAIAERIERLSETSPIDLDGLQELLYGLHALILVHFRKEEDIQLPVFDRQPPEFVDELLARMGGHAHAAH